MNQRRSSMVVPCWCARPRTITFRSRSLFVVMLLTASAQRAAAQGTVVNWTVDGEKREALIVAPATDTPAKRPLVFAFHGHGGTMRGAEQSMHIQTVWPEAIV